MPFRHQFRAIKRALIPYTGDPANDKVVLTTAIRIPAAMHDLRGTVVGSTVVEIGSGWIPLMPLMFRMAGASEIITVDQDRFMDLQTFQHAGNYIREHFNDRLAEEKKPAKLFELRRLPTTSTSVSAPYRRNMSFALSSRPDADPMDLTSANASCQSSQRTLRGMTNRTAGTQVRDISPRFYR